MIKSIDLTTNSVHIKRALVTAALVLCLPIMTGCGSSDKTVKDNNLISEIKASEHTSVDDAYEQLKDSASTDSEQAEFIQQLKDLKECSGKFANKTERGNVYSAEVTFYLSRGKIYSTVVYSGYMGEIGDGEVSDSTEKGYLFESEPKGNLYGNEQDFHPLFGKDKLRIAWGESCDYTLDRGDGTPESVENYEVPFDESDTFKKIETLLDENFADYEHELIYNKSKSELNVYFQAPDNLREALNTNNSKLNDSWQKLVDSMKSFSELLLSVTKIGGKAENVNIYWVDSWNNSQSYDESDYILWIHNGTVKYNYADHLSEYPTSPSSNEKKSVYSDQHSESSLGSDSGAITSGEKNALEKAHQYLNYSAFSYSGLIEQLEFEGYSHSEAVYAADHCGADWNEQAVKKAKQYLEYSSFSRSGLVEQLEFEGFTHSQAEYAVREVY